MKIRVKTPPASEPFVASYARDFLRIDGTASDTMLGYLITAGRVAAEEYAGISIVEKTYELALDDYPPNTIKLPYPDLLTLDAITLTAADGTTSSALTTDYIVDTFGSTITRKTGTAFNSISLREANGIIIEYTSGFETVPEDIKQAIMVYVKGQYDNMNPQDFMPAFESLLSAYRVVSI